MASTITFIGERGGIPLARNRRLKAVRVNITSYPTGGESLTPALVGMRRIDSVQVTVSEIAPADQVVHWDRANAKLYAIVASTGAQVANTTDIGEHDLLILGV